MFSNAFHDKTVWISGHTGFKGSWLCEWLLALGARVHGYALPPPTTPALFDQLGLADRVNHTVADIRNVAAVRQAIEHVQPDFVFHLAAQPLVRESYGQPVETYAINVMGAAHVLDALRTLRKPCAAVFVATDKCYENSEWVYGYRENDPLGGHDPYSSSKAAAEIVVSAFRRSFFNQHPVRLASARAGNVIGGGDWAADRIVPDAVRALQQNLPIPVRNPHATRPWQHVLDPLSGYLWLAACLSDCRTVGQSGGQTVPPSHRPTVQPSSDLASAFNFGPAYDGTGTVAELVAEFLKHWPGKWEDHSNPKALHEAGRLQLATDKARALLGWAPVWDFPLAVEQTVAWYRHAGSKRAFTQQQITAYAEHAHAAGLPWAVEQVG